jgi:hypothetical protein
VDVVACECDFKDPESYSPSITIDTARWGDLVGNFVGGVWAAPDGSISVTTDVVSDLEKFGNRAGAPSKARSDVEPGCLDLKINITDVARILDAFRGIGFPFSPTVTDPCQSPCP